jgi:hypothetical protein
MRVSIDIPDELARRLFPDGVLPERAVLEAIALEGYRSASLTEYQVRILLGFEHRLQVHAFLKAHGVYLHYGAEGAAQDEIAAASYEKERAIEGELQRTPSR